MSWSSPTSARRYSVCLAPTEPLAEIEDGPLSRASMVELLLTGGVATTASLMSRTPVRLYQHQDMRADLIAHPEKLPKAVEEFLRYFSPTQALAHRDAAGRSDASRGRAGRASPR